VTESQLFLNSLLSANTDKRWGSKQKREVDDPSAKGLFYKKSPLVALLALAVVH